MGNYTIVPEITFQLFPAGEPHFLDVLFPGNGKFFLLLKLL